jgi:mannose/cellobiose epimerase-like protein (N-acyl-D-glucosamine 2-epimerase family)
MHSFSPAGNGIDTARHLHDHASLIRAGAAAWDAFQIAEAREMASEALAFVTGQLADEANGGWFDTVPGPAEHRASSHMHLLEAMLELGRATDSDHAREIAGAVVGLFEERFFRAGSDDIVERFTTDWSPNCGAKPEIDRGACYQWASLLTYYQRWTGHDTLSWQRRLICRADEIAGRGAATPVNLEGELRKLKAHLLHPALGPEGQREKLFSSICATYLHDRSGGVWGENTDEKGNGASNGLSARMLCLFVEAFGIIAP